MDHSNAPDMDSTLWYLAVTYQPGVEERARRSNGDVRHRLIDAFHKTHHSQDGIVNRDGVWLLDYSDEERCRDAWWHVEHDYLGVKTFKFQK
jgi:hypothetical protein